MKLFRLSGILLCLFIVSCSNDSINTSYPEEINVAWIGPLNGPANLLGVENLKAMELAVKIYNKSGQTPKVLIKKYDDNYDFLKSESIYESLKKKKKLPDMLFLSTYESMFHLSDRLFEDDILTINPIDNDIKLERLNENIILIAKRTEGLARILSAEIKKDKKEKTAILYFDSDSFMPTVANELWRLLKHTNNSPDLYSYGKDINDFSQIISPANLEKYDSLIILAYSESYNILKYIKKTNSKLSLYSLNTIFGIINKPKFKKLTEGMKITHFTKKDGNEKLADNFLDLYQNEYNTHPNVHWVSFQAYDSMQIFLKSLAETYQHESSYPNWKAGIKSIIYKGSVHKCVSGNIRIGRNGNSSGINMGAYVIRNGTPFALKK